MKRINTIILPLLAAAALSSCSKQAAPDSNFPEDRVIRVEASVLPSTKGSYTTDDLNEFAFYSKNYYSDKYTYSKKCFRDPSSFEGWGWEGDAPLWKNSTEEVGMIAIAPVLNNYSNYSFDSFRTIAYGNGYPFQIQTEQSSSDNGSDLIGWCKSGTPSDLLNGDTKVRIEFQHLLSRLNLTFVLATEFNAIDIPISDIVSDVVIKEASIEGLVKYQVMTDNLTVEVASSLPKADVNAYSTGWTAANSKEERCRSQWECILVPEAGINISISFNVNGTAYICTLPGKTLEQGKAHNLTINVGKDVATVGAMSIAGWEDGGSSNLETE
ncbi:MAG: fimbrillin family protein [Candidatus Cryptobacteroides sp.]